MDQWTGTLSKIAPQSHKCVKSWSILLSEMVLNWLYKPTAGHLMRQQPGQLDCQITDGDREAMERFLMLQITKEGRALVRAATGAKAHRPGAPGVLKEWHWKAMVEAWKTRPTGVESVNGYYGHISWNTWLRLRDFKAGALVEEYRTGGPYLAHVGYSIDIHWIRLT
jgi:hypothetical protein